MKRLFLRMTLGIVQRIAPDLFVRNAASMPPQPDWALVAANPAFQQAFARMVKVVLLKLTGRDVQATTDPDGTILLKDVGWRGRFSLVG
jgi:hypothetical protein